MPYLKSFRTLIFRGLILFSLPLFAHNLVVHYDPARVELSGVLDLQTFPGLPNYESISSGDEPERHFYLKLDKPIDAIDLNSDPENERNVKIVQLVIDGENVTLWSRFRKAGRGAHVTIDGQLFHRWTGHHHSRVLLRVEKLTVATL